MKTVLLIRGLPGSGKTTLAEIIPNAFRVAADDFPGIYIDGVYQSHLQKESHDWCFQQFQDAIAGNLQIIIVHNTFSRLGYMQKYQEHAIAQGYSVQVIHVEGTLVKGGRTVSTHNVPDAVINSMLDGWEPLNPKVEHISRLGIAETFDWVRRHPNHKPIVLSDMDGTIKFTKSGKTFPQQPDDAVLNPKWVESINTLKLIDINLEIHVISNQAGLSFNLKSQDFLSEEIRHLDKLLVSDGICPSTYKCSIAKYGVNYLSFHIGESEGKLEYVMCESKSPTYKPNIGLVENIADYYKESRIFWIIGDNDSTDGALCDRLTRQYLHHQFIYVPIDFFPSLAQLHNQNV